MVDDLPLSDGFLILAFLTVKKMGGRVRRVGVIPAIDVENILLKCDEYDMQFTNDDMRVEKERNLCVYRHSQYGYSQWQMTEAGLQTYREHLIAKRQATT